MDNLKIKTPLGELKWVSIYGEGRDTSLDKSGKMQKVAVFSCKAGSEEDKALLATLDAYWQDFAREIKAKNPKAKVVCQTNGRRVVTDENGEDTDEVNYQFKTNAHYADGKPTVIPVYSGSGQKLDLEERGILIGNGSTGVIHGFVGGYEYAGKYGLSLYLKGIQLKKLVEYKGPGLSDDDLVDLGETDLGSGALEVPPL